MIQCTLNHAQTQTQTAYAPLCALGHYLTQHQVLTPLEQVHLPQKTQTHSPTDKLIDALVSMLAGCSALYQLNVKVRPDRPLQQAFGRRSCADQSVVSDTLNVFTEKTVTQLRSAVETIHHHHGRVFTHGYDQALLTLEIDLTGLPASKQAEGSTKGYFPGKRNQRGRQLVRVTASEYEEVIYEKLYPGNTTSKEVLKETVREVERILEMTSDSEADRRKRQQTLIRLDGGFGTDANLNWLCWRGYQFIAKGYSGTRAKKVAASVAEGDWREGPTPGQQLGRPREPHRYGRRTKTVARRWRDKKGKWHQDLLITTLVEFSRDEIAKLYDGRGGMEVDIKGDKRGLGLEKRRKKRFYAQEAMVLLAQLAHNLLIWFKQWFLAGTAAGELGVERLVNEVLAMAGEVEVGRWRRRRKVRLKLPDLHPWAKDVWEGMRVRFSQSERWAIWGQN